MVIRLGIIKSRPVQFSLVCCHLGSRKQADIQSNFRRTGAILKMEVYKSRSTDGTVVVTSRTGNAGKGTDIIKM